MRCFALQKKILLMLTKKKMESDTESLLKTHPNSVFVSKVYDNQGILKRYILYVSDDDFKHATNVPEFFNGVLVQGAHASFGLGLCEKRPLSLGDRFSHECLTAANNIVADVAHHFYSSLLCIQAMVLDFRRTRGFAHYDDDALCIVVLLGNDSSLTNDDEKERLSLLVQTTHKMHVQFVPYEQYITLL